MLDLCFPRAWPAFALLVPVLDLHFPPVLDLRFALFFSCGSCAVLCAVGACTIRMGYNTVNSRKYDYIVVNANSKQFQTLTHMSE